MLCVFCPPFLLVSINIDNLFKLDVQWLKHRCEKFLSPKLLVTTITQKRTQNRILSGFDHLSAVEPTRDQSSPPFSFRYPQALIFYLPFTRKYIRPLCMETAISQFVWLG